MAKLCSTCRRTFTPDVSHRFQCDECQRAKRQHDSTFMPLSTESVVDVSPDPSPSYDAPPDYSPSDTSSNDSFGGGGGFDGGGSSDTF